MTLPKSLRPRNRYVFFEVETLPDASFGEHDLRRAVWFEAQNLYGDVKSAETRAELLEYDGDATTGLGIGIVRCAHDRVEETRAALACVDEVRDDPVGVRVVGVSGTLKAGRNKYGETPTVEETTVEDSPAWRRGDALDLRTDDGFMCGTHHEFGKE